MIKYLFLAFIIITSLFFIAGMPASAGGPEIIPKVGKWCPSGYAPDGEYCRPLSNAKEVIVKQGRWCPKGFAADGSYCKRISAKPSSVIPKKGKWCPQGFVPDGEYCCSIN